MTRTRIAALVLCVVLMPAGAAAQSAPDTRAGSATTASRLWLVAGSAFVTFRGDCQTCEQDFPYRHAPGVLATVGRRITDQMDVGAELFWMPAHTFAGHARLTHIDAVAQFRPWSGHGFFVKGGAGMAFLRHWVDAVVPSPSNQKALSVVVGAGWTVHPTERLGLQVFAAQHAGAIGDVTTATADIQDVMGNFWSVGAAIVIR